MDWKRNLSESQLAALEACWRTAGLGGSTETALPCPACGCAIDAAPGLVICTDARCRWTAEGAWWDIAEAARQRKREGKPAEDGAPVPLPALVWGPEIEGRQIELPPELIAGILHQGAKMVLGGGSKSFKTWCLADLAISISAGVPWWGREVRKGRVVYLNLEVSKPFFERRLQDIAHAKGCPLSSDLGVWNLRGHCTDHAVLLPRLADELAGQKIAAIVLDPTYKVMTRSENAQEEVAALMNSIERLGEQTGAAVIFGSHFAKGNASGKEAIDRISGSGVFARDPDAILTMTRHEEPDTFVIDPILRNCPPVEPFCVTWEFPLMRHADGLDVTALKQPATGKKPGFSAADAVRILGAGMSRPEWVQAIRDGLGVGNTKAYGLIADAEKCGAVVYSQLIFRPKT